MALIKNRVYRQFVFILGGLSLTLGVLGVFLPLLPTTPFVLLASWCFFRSSPKAYNWLSEQPVLGKALKDWEKNKAISRKTKIIAISMILVSLFFMWSRVINVIILYSVTGLLVILSCFILTRREPRDS